MSPTTIHSGIHSIPFSLPEIPAIPEFIGREEDLASLWALLNPGTLWNDHIVVLHGTGGIGKTQLILRFAETYQDAFTAIIWLDAKSRESLIFSLAKASERLSSTQRHHAGIEVQHSEEERSEKMLRWLGIPANSRWLLVFDDADRLTLDQIRDYFPAGPGAGIVITTRRKALCQLGRPFPVEKFPPQEAIKVFKSSAHLFGDLNEENESDIENLCIHLDGHPLALSLAGEFTRSTGCTAAEYLQWYKTQWVELQSASRPSRWYPKGTLNRTWSETYRALESDYQQAALFLDVICFLNDDKISFSAFQNTLQEHQRRLIGEEIFNKYMRLIVAYSFADVLSDGTYSINFVLRSWIRSRIA